MLELVVIFSELNKSELVALLVERRFGTVSYSASQVRFPTFPVLLIVPFKLSSSIEFTLLLSLVVLRIGRSIKVAIIATF